MCDASPNERTDRHSLAVLLLHTLLFRNVMQPLCEYADDPNQSEELGWGRHALFSEHPRDRRHRPRNLGLPFYRRGALSYRMLTPALQRLTERAFLEGLREPEKRPLAREWEEALAVAIDELFGCWRCRQHFPYPYWEPLERRACPFCGERCQPPYPLVLELHEERQRGSFFPIRRVVLGSAFNVFADVVEPKRQPPFSRQNEPVVGYVEWDSRGRRYRLINDGQEEWTALVQGKRFPVRKEESVLVERGCLLRFGDGKWVAYVVEEEWG